MEEDLDDQPYPGYWDDGDAVQEDVSPRDAVDEVTDVATLIAVHTAEQYLAIAALHRQTMADLPRRGVDGAMVERSLRLELAGALRVTEHEAGMLLARAVALVDRYPRALEALLGARITDQHARFLVTILGGVEPDVAARLIDRAVELAERLPAGLFRRTLRGLVESEAAASLPERHTRALEDRRVFVEPSLDGMAYLTAHLPAVEAQALFARLTRMGKAITGRGAATAGEADRRTLDQVRADILCDLLLDGTCDAHPAAVRGIRATVVVTVPALSLLDDDHADRHPATVEGVGPIPIDRARELCGAGAKWMRVLTHPETGMVLSVGRDRYDPPPELKRLVRWRAERCMAPGCTMPASRCEIDHTQAWQHGGHTRLDNHAPLCTGHHHVKHHGGWIVRQLPDSGGVIEWISPYGRRYLVEPERRVPVFRPVPEEEPAPF